MSDIQKYVKLKRVVSFALDEDDKSDFDKYWQFGFRALAFLYPVIEEPKTWRLPLKDNNTVDWPIGMIDWSKVGVMGEDGKIVTLALNKTISKFRANHPDRIDKLQATVSDSPVSDLRYLNFLQDGYCQHYISNQAQLLQPGEFNVDEDSRLFVLPLSFRFDEIYVEGICSPEEDRDYEIEQCLQEAVIEFIRWKAKTGSRAEFFAALRFARKIYDPIREQVVNQTIREGIGWKIKA